MNGSPCGACTSANAGTSSVKVGEKPARRKSKVSWATLIVPGSVGPKPRPKGVGDGQLVHIPVPPRVRYTDGRTNARDRKSTRLNSSHANISYAVFCLKKKKQRKPK